MFTFGSPVLCADDMVMVGREEGKWWWEWNARGGPSGLASLFCQGILAPVVTEGLHADRLQLVGGGRWNRGLAEMILMRALVGSWVKVEAPCKRRSMSPALSFFHPRLSTLWRRLWGLIPHDPATAGEPCFSKSASHKFLDSRYDA